MNALESALVALAGTPDACTTVEEQLQVIADAAPRLLDSVDHAAVTMRRNGGFYTVAASAQFTAAIASARNDLLGLADQELAVVGTGTGDPAVGMEWPEFRQLAFSVGLFAALSIPLSAGSGAPVAELHLYSQAPAEMAAMIAPVVALYHDAWLRPAAQGLDGGGDALLQALVAALDVRRDIQQALGVLMESGRLSASDAYIILCQIAEDSSATLHELASEVLRRASAEEPVMGTAPIEP